MRGFTPGWGSQAAGRIPLIRVSVFNEHVADMRHVADVGAVALYGLIEVLVRNRPVNHPTRPCPEPVRRASKTH
jgi:hypothetical protein